MYQVLIATTLCGFLNSPTVKILESIGTLLTLILGLGWLKCGLARIQEMSRRRKTFALGDRGSVVCERHLPGVAVIMPVKGCKEHSVSNWLSQISMQYNGPTEFIFVVESEDDPAYIVLERIAKAEQGNISVVVAGFSTTCSQKIHNQLTGVEMANPASKYAFFLDDDVQLHQSSLEDLVGCLENDSSLFMATGYPHDIVTDSSSYFANCIAAVHHVLGIGTCMHERHMFIWGGCMLLPLSILQCDKYGITTAFRNGGYSDDLIMVTTCKEFGLVSICPLFSVYPQRIGNCSFWQFWNYVRRQLFVLDTYRNLTGRLMNNLMLLALGTTGLALPFPVFVGFLRLAAWLVIGDTSACANTFVALPPVAKVWLASWAFSNLAWFWCQAQTERLFAVLSPDKDPPRGR
mmetsp:Transcript_19855/g.55228  ORF Transcript_19855/g.55228 Transcript_19855/m.55228 type:complete len:405 (+) Transcript_19855:295-1509(+)|eukprot:CAMPEP_0117655512 /NCGR_PEP_ID=MMETSP0804-20121206/4317_1 /TAXON_ID=1074897 /ORGANISM="Tetraselmis astigmatica, Strain CCMP880" /LENGTH=404 /DNA_ID=CAMNT_0005461865 /DNA_START=213 /DNA_END=1427 /DNA_ORIENTATION=+